MKSKLFLAVAAMAFCGVVPARGAESAVAGTAPRWAARPLTLAECLNLALEHNGEVLKSRHDLEATHGVVVQTRAVVIPKLRATGDYAVLDESSVEKLNVTLPPALGLPSGALIDPGDQRWSAGVQLVQSLYAGGRLTSAVRSARLLREQALTQHQIVLADTALAVRVAYDDVLLAEQQVVVQEASVKLLQSELEDNTRRYDAGTVPRFNVLRAEVELANARPRLIRARNALRIGKNNLANLLGDHVAAAVQEDLPMTLTGRLEYAPFEIGLSEAIARALADRPELAALRLGEQLRREGIVTARAGARPSLQSFVGYGGRNSSFSSDPLEVVKGWQVGVQMTWDVFDGGLTQGKVRQARALHEKARVEIDDAERRVELEVRTALSNFVEAREVLESQKKVKEQADEALRLARARSDAGTGTQLDVLSAQTALTEARTTEILALRDVSVARARLERALGANLVPAVSAGESSAAGAR